MKKTSDALAILNRRFGGDPEYQEMLAEERVMAQAARAIYEARKAAGLSQKQLAELVGTQQPSIARLEDGDYEGHSLAMLDRIARAIGLRVEVRFTPPESARNSTHASTADMTAIAEAVRRAAREGAAEGVREGMSGWQMPKLVPHTTTGVARREAAAPHDYLKVLNPYLSPAA